MDPVIQIANMVTVQGGSSVLHNVDTFLLWRASFIFLAGESVPRIRNVFTLKKCANIVGSQVLSYETEEELLQAWSAFVTAIDPDVVTGYNIANFDFPYLLDRATHLKVARFPYLGRLAGVVTRAKDTTFSSKAYGTRESKTLSKQGEW
jgi:DNA polymerase delta subunit 1